MERCSRRLFLGSVAMGLSGIAAGQSVKKACKSPNVILIVSDDQGSADVGCYGSTDLLTPNLDRLASQGVRFTRFYAASSICSPSRGALLTGRYPRRNGLEGNAGRDSGLPVGEITLADLFSNAGYRTAVFGKWHLGMQEEMAPLNRGFQEFFGHKEGCIDNYSHFFYWSGPNRHDLWKNDKPVHLDGEFFPDIVNHEACRFIQENKDRPFFLYLPFNLPHYPMQAKESFTALYPHLEEPRKRYAAWVSNLDECIGKVLSSLEESALTEDTLVVFLSDNGHSLEERAFYGGGSAGAYRGCKFTLWEGGIRVPCIVSWPGVLPQGEVRSQTVSAMDWLPTLARLCKLSLPDRILDGRDISGIIQDEQAETNHPVLHWMLNEQWAVMRGAWKLVCNVPRIALENRDIPPEHLFLGNLDEDPEESRNLAEQYPEMVAELTGLHDAWLKETEGA